MRSQGERPSQSITRCTTGPTTRIPKGGGVLEEKSCPTRSTGGGVKETVTAFAQEEGYTRKGRMNQIALL